MSKNTANATRTPTVACKRRHGLGGLACWKHRSSDSLQDNKSHQVHAMPPRSPVRSSSSLKPTTLRNAKWQRLRQLVTFGFALPFLRAAGHLHKSRAFHSGIQACSMSLPPRERHEESPHVPEETRVHTWCFRHESHSHKRYIETIWHNSLQSAAAFFWPSIAMPLGGSVQNLKWHDYPTLEHSLSLSLIAITQ